MPVKNKVERGADFLPVNLYSRVGVQEIPVLSDFHYRVIRKRLLCLYLKQVIF